MFSFISFLSAVVLFYSHSLLLALSLLIMVMGATLYLAVWRADLKVAGLKGVRNRIRAKRTLPR